ncbi:MAG: IS3 family transposase [Ktedonobacteraceae bacterium]|nr:IS3 family transposase [Ktedonobacteraceae bacterium]
MASSPKKYSSDFKAKVALEAIKGQKTLNEISSEYGVHSTQITQWKKQVLDELPEIFARSGSERAKSEEALIASLYQQIGQLKVETDFLKKKSREIRVEHKRLLIEPDHPQLSIVRQCELLGLARSSYYYQSMPESEEDLLLMRLLDEQYTRTPFYGMRKMVVFLQEQGYTVDRKRVRRLMRLMGLETIYPKPHLSLPGEQSIRYPYLLRGMSINRRDQVWSCDITYIRLARGSVFLMAIIDWFSRFVLAWELSITLDTHFCLEALDRALEAAHPEIFNTDQGAQFTSHDWTSRLRESGIRISWDGRGRALDNIFVERLWRSVKYEEVYLKDYQTVSEARNELAAYFQFYNYERYHQSLDYKTPFEVYRSDHSQSIL